MKAHSETSTNYSDRWTRIEMAELTRKSSFNL